MALRASMPPAGSRLDLNHSLCQSLTGLWFYDQPRMAYNLAGGNPGGSYGTGADTPVISTANGMRRARIRTDVLNGFGLGNPASLGVLGSFSVVLRVNSISSPGFSNQFVLARNDDLGSNRGFVFTAVDTFVGANGPTLYVTADGTTFFSVSMNSSVFWSAEAVIGCTYDAGTGSSSIYYNGELAATGVTVAGGNGLNSGQFEMPYTLNGDVYWGACFSQALTPDAMRSWSDQTWPMFRRRRTAPPLGYLTFDNRAQGNDTFEFAGPFYLTTTASATVGVSGIGAIEGDGSFVLETIGRGADTMVLSPATLLVFENIAQGNDTLVISNPFVFANRARGFNILNSYVGGNRKIVRQNVYRR